MKRLDAYWESRNTISLLLLPLSWLFCFVASLRRLAYRLGLKQVNRLPVSVIVVGNITVGGAGKTPLVIWLAGFLKELGFKPGIVARGYGADIGEIPRKVTLESKASEVGDEPLLIARRTQCPMFVSPNRVAAAKALLDKSDCDVIISDDGMQHYALGRDIEIAVVDGKRRFGNGFCLPAGPLRELPSRLNQVDLVIANGEAGPGEYAMHVSSAVAVNLVEKDLTYELERFAGQQVHALAGIGDPQRFFNMLRDKGLCLIEHAFSDHYRFEQADVMPEDELPVLMTEKDAVKCDHFAQSRHWYVPISVEVDEAFSQRLTELLRGLKGG